MTPWARWRDGLRALPLDVPHLSPAGARLAWDDAVDALTDAAAESLRGPAARRTGVVGPTTVFTAPLPFVAGILWRGGEAVWKAPRGQSAMAVAVAKLAQIHGLPLVATESRDALIGCERIIATVSDATAAELAGSLGDRLVAFGHRYAVAWVTDVGEVEGIARDLASHDGRGCMAPTTVFTPLPNVVPALVEALDRAAARWPQGPLTDVEGARHRERALLAQALGRVTRARRAEVHELPPSAFEPDRPGRHPVVHHVRDVHEAVATLGPYARWLGGVAATRDEATWHKAGATRVVAPGTLSRPRWDGRHDGVAWLEAVLRG